VVKKKTQTFGLDAGRVSSHGASLPFFAAEQNELAATSFSQSWGQSGNGWSLK
jgi:hypothetical protein